MLHGVGDARCPNHLGRVSPTAHRPGQLGLCLNYTVINHTPFASSLLPTEQASTMWERTTTAHVAGTWALVFFKDARERCMGTFVHSPQCGGGGDDIGSGVSTEDNVSLQICDEPRPRAVSRERLFLSVFERRSRTIRPASPCVSIFRSLTLIMSTTLT